MTTLNDQINKLELLRMARELAVNEYIDRRAELHNRWLDESDKLWSTRRARLPYPTIPPYPTEAEILLKADALLAFISNENATKAMTPPKPPGPPPEDIIETPNVETNSAAADAAELPNAAGIGSNSNASIQTVSVTDNTDSLPAPQTPTDKQSQDLPPAVDYGEYGKARARRRVDDDTTSTGRVVEMMVRKFNQLTGSNSSE